MEFEFTFNEIDQEAMHRNADAEYITEILNNFLCKMDYGKDILSYQIICICVRTRPGYEDWFKARKPKYITSEIIENEFTSEKTEIKNQFIQEIKLDNAGYEYLISCSKEESHKYLIAEILRSIDDLRNMPKKIKNFDKGNLISDLKRYCKEKELV